jgi:acetyl-CoA carboxylase carboxyltransferase component
MNLCDVFDVPILFLCDCPGFMVGIESESQGALRHMCRMITLGGSMSVPTFCVVTRKAYGLGAQGMGGGSHHAPNFTVAWPTGEFGGMGLEGAVKLGMKKELLAQEKLEDRRALFDSLVESAYESGKAVKYAEMFEIDDVIDPADTRRWLVRGLQSCPPVVGWQEREKKK